ncbi:MAG: hypothetical protein KDC80_04030 [Saprospiraceae bacterium]|nr:hypothetical protein [Saprospiraceae bacterium]
MERFLNIFQPEELTGTIKRLARQQLLEDMWIADGFELTGTSFDMLKYFIRDPEKCSRYESSFLLFAQATHSGSIYAFYKKSGLKNCDEWPVIVLGDEGGVLVLAENIFGAMRFWTLNSVQPYVSGLDLSFDLFHSDDEIIPSNESYKKWIRKEFDLDPILNIAQAEKDIIKPAFDKYQQELTQIFEDQ